MHLKLGYLFLLLTILTNCSKKSIEASPSPQVEFIKIGGEQDDEARDIICRNDYLYTIGTTGSLGDPNGDIHFLKLDVNGNVLVEKTFGGNGIERGIRLAATSDGNFILIGTTESKGAGAKDIWVIKVDSGGNVIWDKTFGGIENDDPADVIQLENGNYVVAGTTESFGAGSRDMYVLWLDENGNKYNEFIHGGEDIDGCSQVIEMVSNQLMLFGYTTNFGADSRDFYLLNISNFGERIRVSKRFGGSGYEESHAMIRDYGGNFILHGHSASTEPNHNMYTVVVRRDETFTNGITLNEVRHFNYGGANHDGGQAITINSQNQYVMIGTSMSFSTTMDIIFTRVSAEGKALEYTEFDEGNNEYPYDVIDFKGHYYIVGYTESAGKADTDILIVKVRKEG